MEIDLNHGVNVCCNGDCLCSSTSSCSSNSSSSPSSSSIYMELWHACAGPLTSLPKKGNVVVYFSQGHLEQAASPSLSSFPPIEGPTFDLKPQKFCRVVDVQLLANKENDEVYAQLTLLPQSDSEILGKNLEGKENEGLGVDEDGGGVIPAKSTPQMFCKTLTASDTSTHGGFSVPRRAAEDCFPPLDYEQQRPSQELVAKDLHGVEWRFRHIYRGQPRRHLLTTGWSVFVSQKNLVSGDAILFLSIRLTTVNTIKRLITVSEKEIWRIVEEYHKKQKGEGGDLRLGIRRAARPRNGVPDSVMGNQNSYSNILSLVANAISTKSVFHVFYSPRASHADFVLPYEKYLKSIANQILIGTRFKTKFEMDDSPERRFSGVVTGIGDLDPYRWPNSKWRCVMVRWDENIVSDRQTARVSPWEIDLSVSLPPSIQSSPRLKKLRTSLQATPPKNPVSAAGGGFLDFEESVRSSKVLQGQENLGSAAPLYGFDNMNHPLNFEMQSTVHQSLASNGMRKRNFSEAMRTQPSTAYTDFSESNRFPKVLQGQEICSLRSLTGKTDFNLGAWGKTDPGYNFLNMFQRPTTNFYPLASEGIRNTYFPCNDIYKAGQDPVMLSCMSNLPRENIPLDPTSIQSGVMRDEVRKQNLTSEQRPLEKIFSPPNLEANSSSEKDDTLNGTVTDCKLFGFSLTGETSTSNSQYCKRSCTKVHKQGNMVGRAIDLSRLNGYDDLLIELERLFNMEGLLRDPNKGWRILFTDDENDMMVVGDDPWHEFCNVVCKIHIYTQEEVQKMMIGMISDDTQSCLEEAPAILDVSKSSSVGQPD